jgi:hypothetical protein
MIVAFIEYALTIQDYVPGTTFLRLSMTGASTRMEVFRALFIGMAQKFDAVIRGPVNTDALREFDAYAAATGGVAFTLASSVVPDSELDTISKLRTSNDRKSIRGRDLSREQTLKRMQQELEFIQEERRLQSLVMSDAAWNQSETMESFVAFLKTLNPSDEEYWPMVYRRIGLACPFAEVPDQPAPKVPWWQRLFGKSAEPA